LKVIGWGWFYLSTILDDYSRYVIGWKLCGNMRAEDVTDTLDIALAASGCGTVSVTVAIAATTCAPADPAQRLASKANPNDTLLRCLSHLPPMPGSGAAFISSTAIPETISSVAAPVRRIKGG